MVSFRNFAVLMLTTASLSVMAAPAPDSLPEAFDKPASKGSMAGFRAWKDKRDLVEGLLEDIGLQKADAATATATTTATATSSIETGNQNYPYWRPYKRSESVAEEKRDVEWAVNLRGPQRLSYATAPFSDKEQVEPSVGPQLNV